MTEIPNWWLLVTGIAAILFVVLIAVMAFLIMTLIKLVQDLQQPVTKLLDQVNDLVPEVKGLVVKVEALTEKVEAIADSTKVTVDSVGEKTKAIAATVDGITAFASRQLQQYAPIIGSVLTGIRMFNAFREYKKSKPKVRVERTANGSLALEIHAADGEAQVKKGKVNKHRGVEQSGSSSGS